MGLTNSKHNTCPYCGIGIKLPDDEEPSPSSSHSQQKDDLIFTCSRCHGALFKKIKFERYPQSIQFLHIAPFADKSLSNALKIEEMPSIFEEKIEFEEELDEEMKKALSMSLEPDQADVVLINDYLIPFFDKYSKNMPIQNGSHLIIKGIEFKVLSCYPPYGFVSKSTKFTLTDDDDTLFQLQRRPIHRIHILPTKASLATYAKHEKIEYKEAMSNIFKSHIHEYLKGNDTKLFIHRRAIGHNLSESDSYSKRYLMEKQVFFYKGVQFRVMKCEPFDGFIDMEKTQIFCHGNAINDIKRIALRPIKDQLPHFHKLYSSQQVINHYIKGHMFGKNEYLDEDENDVLNIKDVTFMLTECEPNNGILTALTKISNASPITNEEIREIQSQKDAELARSIQENDRNSQRQRRMMMYDNMQQIMQNNQNDPFMSFMRLMEQYNAIRMDGFGMQQEEKENGLDEQIIHSLPTYKYKKKKGKSDDADADTCRICLQEFKDGDEMRTLTCFHSFHKECVDQWLHINDKCPICKHSLIPNT